MIDSIVFGHKGHATIADLNIKPDDHFAFEGVSYLVIMIAPNTIGSIQAYCKVRA